MRGKYLMRGKYYEPDLDAELDEEAEVEEAGELEELEAADRNVCPTKPVWRQITWQQVKDRIPEFEQLVINVRKMPPQELARQIAGGQLVYVARAVPRAGLAGSPFGNPFVVDREAGNVVREEVAEQYLRHVLKDSSLRPKLPSLRGRRLGCWCAPKLCHAHVLAVLANGLLPAEASGEFVHGALSRLEIHLRRGDFEQCRRTLADLERQLSEDSLPQGPLSREERCELNLVELPLEEKLRTLFKRAGIATAGELLHWLTCPEPVHVAHVGATGVYAAREALAAVGLWERAEDRERENAVLVSGGGERLAR